MKIYRTIPRGNELEDGCTNTPLCPCQGNPSLCIGMFPQVNGKVFSGLHFFFAGLMLWCHSPCPDTQNISLTLGQWQRPQVQPQVQHSCGLTRQATDFPHSMWLRNPALKPWGREKVAASDHRSMSLSSICFVVHKQLC